MLMTVMTVVVMSSAFLYSCTDKKRCEILLQNIQKEAENPKDLTEEDLNIRVPKIYNQKCTKNFFCLAEKVLENVTFSHNNINERRGRNTKSVVHHGKGFKNDTKLEMLKRNLVQYNNLTGQTSCHLDTIYKHELQAFLHHLAKCAKIAYNHTR